MKTSLRRAIAALATICTGGLLALGSSTAAAQGFPSKPVRLVMPFTPGSGLDQLVRPAAEHMSTTLGQPVLIEYKPGGGGRIATNYVMSQPADGYTVLVATNTIASNSLEPNAPFDIRRDVVPLGRLSGGSLVIAVNTEQIKATNMKEFIEYVRTRPPGEISYASYGKGSLAHMPMELLQQEAGIKMVHIPFPGSSQATMETVAGRTALTIGITATLKPHSTDGGSGKLRLIGVTTAERSPDFPNLQGMREAGHPNIDFASWGGMFTRVGTPPDAVAKLSKALEAVTSDPKIQEAFVRSGTRAGGSSVAEFGKLIQQETANYAKVFATIDRDK